MDSDTVWCAFDYAAKKTNRQVLKDKTQIEDDDGINQWEEAKKRMKDDFDEPT